MHAYADLVEKNKRYLWNPFTQMKDYFDRRPVVIARGEGRRLIDIDGNAYWDGVSSLWLNVHGHRVPELDDAIRRQLEDIAHSTLLGQANVPAILLAERLAQIAPTGLTKVFFSDSGAEAVEIALKMAYQFWQNTGKCSKSKFVTMCDGYHGDTIGAVSVGDIPMFHARYAPLLFQSYKIPFPNRYRNPYTSSDPAFGALHAVEELFQREADQIAALIVEPVQGAGGIVPAPKGFLTGLRALCDTYDVLLIVDEVATGFGRTGRMWACEHDGVSPDILTVGKGLTGGYLPVAATLATERIYTAFYGEYEEFKALYHGHSYTGNQLGCACALANLELIERNRIIDHVAQSARVVSTRLNALRDHPHVGDIRQAGLMIGIELVEDRETKRPFPLTTRAGWRVCWQARELGMLLRPLGDVVVFMPPLASTVDEIQEMTSILCDAVERGLKEVVGK
ncbi:adenosylmethionine--8-amino-7-oxononanoate transaminase [Alicyclobacillus mali]|uniref:Adenosylmethionine-8-amino-7-oxononanoate aminotransferase n=1 Tax=Alicyclobacillus mali (ex Roth et al. 2021) TaxID=1123961 RepID=A0ABS0F1Z8_9BACL|nr:adenosylmethionine--8-amino-7-oxononanoate transaminase [Alicyclobacillus mali (ex Roth et al. 2021)]MBF8377319.1 adenosylmethionine--8-amino-7-oxononanoate transaminase [Alicyclobacillus mali (ex Roth et al. 2021)]